MQEEMIYSDMTDFERQVSEYLDKLNIKWNFEYPVFLKDERNRPRLWTPDFFLPELNVYVEVCGSENFDYEYRKRRYYENNIDVIYLHLYRDSKEWQNHFKERLIICTKDRLALLNRMMDLAFK